MFKKYFIYYYSTTKKIFSFVVESTSDGKKVLSSQNHVILQSPLRVRTPSFSLWRSRVIFSATAKAVAKVYQRSTAEWTLTSHEEYNHL